jgi:predicted nucleotidyltransferase
LTLQERSAIAEAARATLAAGTQVSLFGSRTDDQARGGDIDLLVETPLPMPAAELVARRQAFVARLYRLLGDTRIHGVRSSISRPDQVHEGQRTGNDAWALGVWRRSGEREALKFKT